MGYPISAFCLVQIVSKVVPMCFLTPNAGGVMVHDDLEHDPELKFEVNPISGRLLATPISGKGGLFRTPLDISGSYRSIFKIQTAFDSPQHDLHL